MAQSDAGACKENKSKSSSFSRKVTLIKLDDACTSFSDMYNLPDKSVIELSTRMTQDSVKNKILETFPYLERKRSSFRCAASKKINNNKKEFVFGGSRIWDGKTIRAKINANSNLYILEEQRREDRSSSDDESPVLTSGISESDQESSENVEDTSIIPKSGSVEGRYPFHFNFRKELSEDVSSGRVDFFGVASVVAQRIMHSSTLTGIVPSRLLAGTVNVTAWTDAGDFLGETHFTYHAKTPPKEVKELVDNPNQLYPLFSSFSEQFGFSVENECGIGDSYSSVNLQDAGSYVQLKKQQSVKFLELLLYTAAEEDAQRFVEMLFSTSAGPIVFNSYKSRRPLPEDVAQANGNDDLAQYLRDMNTRLSEEKPGETESNSINWLELAKAVQQEVDLPQDQSRGLLRNRTDNESEDNSSNNFADSSSSASSDSDDKETLTVGDGDTSTAVSDNSPLSMFALKTSYSNRDSKLTLEAIDDGPTVMPERIAMNSEAQMHKEEEDVLYPPNGNDREDLKSLYLTTSTFRPKSARIEILHQCRQLSNSIALSQSSEFLLRTYGKLACPYPYLEVQIVVAVKDEETKEIWDCNVTSDLHQIYMTRDRLFTIVPELSGPCRFVFSHSFDCRKKPVPPFAANLVFALPVEHATPCRVKIKLCKGVDPHYVQVLDEVKYDFLCGSVIAKVENPLAKIQKQGGLAGKMGNAIMRHFRSLVDNGRYSQFQRDRDYLAAHLSGKVKYQDLLSAVLLEEAIMYFGRNKMEDCLAKCWEVHARAVHCNSENRRFLLGKAFCITSALYRHAKEFDKAEEYIIKSSECLEPASLSEETAINRYNAASLMAEKSATFDLTPEEERECEKLIEEVAGIWSHQRENETLRCVMRSYNRMIFFFLKTSRSAFPDLRKPITEVHLAKAGEAIQKLEKNFLPHSPKRLEATFLIGKADYYIRRATMKRKDITQQQRAADFQKANTVLKEAMRISEQLRMQTEIDGIFDRNETIQNLLRNGPNPHPDPNPKRPQQNQPPSRGRGKVNPDDLDDLFPVIIQSVL